MRSIFLTWARFSALLAAAVLSSLAQEDSFEVLNRSSVHLRSGNKPEWDEYSRTPDGTNLVLRFNGRKNATDATLFINQDNVKLDWAVELNGKRIGTLFLMEAPLIETVAVAAGALRDGDNTLAIRPPKGNDDITIGRIALDQRPRTNAVSGASLDVQVTETDTGRRLPCRITIIDHEGSLAPLQAKPGQNLAVRPGVLYTGTGNARLGIRPGEYTVYATRGPEYGLGTARVTIAAGETSAVRLQIAREVDTTGWACSDTHIHTGEFARHGDASRDDRMLTVAGEGIELPISTEHDGLVDYSEAATRTGVRSWFTPVLGDEVTTPKGHFNIFPVDPSAAVPDRSITNWPQLMTAFRATPGVQVVILNHPRNIHSNFQPFAATNYNAVTGENLRGFKFTFDAIEVANSSALQSNWMLTFYDWFALLNYGYRFTAVGSSDCHDVSRYIVGQGRTYMRCDDADPARLDVDQACRSIKAGRAVVSLGLFVDMTVDDRFGIGDLAVPGGPRLKVAVSIQAPSWISADRLELFANGIRVGDRRIDAAQLSTTAGRPPAPFHARVEFDLPRPTHDVHLIALATGPAVTASYWSLARPYQPTSPTWNPKVLGITNPIWVDADKDGKFTAARGYAGELVQAQSGDASALVKAAANYDEAVAAQVASVCAHGNWDRKALEDSLRAAPEHVGRGFRAFWQAEIESRAGERN